MFSQYKHKYKGLKNIWHEKQARKQHSILSPNSHSLFSLPPLAILHTHRAFLPIKSNLLPTVSNSPKCLVIFWQHVQTCSPNCLRLKCCVFACQKPMMNILLSNPSLSTTFLSVTKNSFALGMDRPLHVYPPAWKRWAEFTVEHSVNRCFLPANHLYIYIQGSGGTEVNFHKSIEKTKKRKGKIAF